MFKKISPVIFLALFGIKASSPADVVEKNQGHIKAEKNSLAKALIRSSQVQPIYVGQKEKNFYEILKLNKDASKKQIKQARKKLLSKSHVDKQYYSSDDESAAAAVNFEEVRAAGEVLTDKKKKKEYDENVFPGGILAWRNFQKKKKEEAKKASFQKLNDDFEKILDKGEEHDENGRNFFHAIYAGHREQLIPSMKVMAGANIALTMKWINEPFKEKTIFYQALENVDLVHIGFLLDAKFIDGSGHVFEKTFINTHPKNNPHPIELLYDIEDYKLEHLDKKDIKKLLANAFINNGLDKEGLDWLKKKEPSLFEISEPPKTSEELQKEADEKEMELTPTPKGIQPDFFDPESSEKDEIDIIDLDANQEEEKDEKKSYLFALIPLGTFLGLIGFAVLQAKKKKIPMPKKIELKKSEQGNEK